MLALNIAQSDVGSWIRRGGQGILARQFKVAGGSIRNAALTSGFLAAEAASPITMELVMLGLKREFQKLGRLRTDLRSWRANPKGSLQMLEHVLVDPDFAGVRDEECLAKLPAAERAEWVAFWKEVREALATAKEGD